ncbi:MAG: hypothetical protein J6Y25_04665 [Elusimicrobiaceae bacterium]|nr:hypothetical protein [Elusimicrobiaceae bacterium]
MSKKYIISNAQQIVPLWADIKNAVEKGRVVTVEVKSAATKTKEQLGYYWSVVIPAVQEGMREHGNELKPAEVNEILNAKFFSNIKTVSWVSKEGIQYVHQLEEKRSKSGATKDEMSHFLDQVIRWAGEDLGIYIPKPTTEESPDPGQGVGGIS